MCFIYSVVSDVVFEIVPVELVPAEFVRVENVADLAHAGVFAVFFVLPGGVSESLQEVGHGFHGHPCRDGRRYVHSGIVEVRETKFDSGFVEFSVWFNYHDGPVVLYSVFCAVFWAAGVLCGFAHYE